MPIFYSTNAPTPTTLNSINSVSINIRDFLLQKNLQPTYPSISTSINGGPRIGEPVLDTETNFLNYYPQQKLEGNTSALDLLGSVINGQGIGVGAGGTPVPNFDVRASLVGRVLGATGVLSDTKIGTIGAQQLALALANNAAFNVQQDILGALNVQDNILALVKGGPLPGLRPNYKITVPSSVGGRIFNSVASVLGFTVPRSYLDDSGSIFQNESGLDTENIKRANSMIVNTGKGQTEAMLKNVNSNLISSADTKYGFFRSGYAPAYENNKGDVIVRDYKLYAYDDGQGHFIPLLGFKENDVIPNLSIFREEKTKESGFYEMPVTTARNFRLKSDDSSDNGNNTKGAQSFPTKKTWVTNKEDAVNNEFIGGDPVDLNNPLTKKSLLTKTQKLFNSKGFKTLISSKGDMNINETQIQTAVVGGGISKGNAVLKGNRFNVDGTLVPGNLESAEKTYCRSWTSHDRYDTVSKMVRSSGLYTGENEEQAGIKVPYRFKTEGSVLDDNGFPKIAPYKKETTDPKRYMFSIENLAWADNHAELPACELGSGDLISGKKGRIMWFPPYDINFSEQNSINWESTNFIGRGEPVYTYNNTERSGNLSFKVIVDHPSYVNSFAGPDGPTDHYVNSFWAGCVEPNTYFSDKLVSVVEKSYMTDTETIPQKKVVPAEEPPGDMVIYFPNDNAALPQKYEDGLSGNTKENTSIGQPIDYSISPDGAGFGLGNYTKDFTPGATKVWPDRYNYGLNNNGPDSVISKVGDDTYRGWLDKGGDYSSAIINYLANKCKHCVVEVSGYASPQGTLEYNIELANARRDRVLADIKNRWGKIGLQLTDEEIKKRFKAKDAIPISASESKCPVDGETDLLPCKKDRKAVIHFRFDEELAAADTAQPEPIIKKTDRELTQKIKNRYYNECNYFEKLKQEDEFIFDEFRKKIKYFHPAFHSTTPEGLNSRLTFLLQCTRQGPTTESVSANNLAFGRPPVCILRIGDFYNTKIVMDNVSIDYEPLVWDLNPEGIGVQPMIANVTISFKFLGGSTLMGPINKLQNALSFNYFANTQVYDPRADYIVKASAEDRPNNEIRIRNSDGTTSPGSSGQVPESVTGYYINNDRPNMNFMETTILSNIAAPNTDTNQAAASQNSGVAPNDISSATTSATTIDDKKVLSRLTLFEFKWDPNNTEQVLYRFNYNQNPPLALDKNSGKTYKGTITLKNWTTSEVTVLDTVKIRYNDDNSVIMNTSTEEVVLPSTQSDRWLMDSEISNGDKLTQAKADTTSNYSVTLQWDVDGSPKSNANIIYSIQ
jgi:hypothetical protein